MEKYSLELNIVYSNWKFKEKLEVFQSVSWWSRQGLKIRNVQSRIDVFTEITPIRNESAYDAMEIKNLLSFWRMNSME